ncbi:MAG: hypothetical protein ABI169_15855, partial [Chitinophagaceae bacterium]
MQQEWLWAEFDYYPFGMEMPGRTYTASIGLESKFGFNGQMKDDEVAGKGNLNTAKFWEYDTRTGRRWNTDPVSNPSESPYATNHDNPVHYTDPTGDKPDFVKGSNGGIKWDNKATSQATTKTGETYLGKTLIFIFNSYIDKKLWDGPMFKIPAGDKLTSLLYITGQADSKGGLVGLAAGSHVSVGNTPTGTARNYYPGLGPN